MPNTLGSPARPLRIAVIGAGPSGFYAAGALLQQKKYIVGIDMFDRLPAPFGLVRYGVAPDHQKIKAVTKIYDRTASDPRFRFFGNVNMGTDIKHADLKAHYDHILYAIGAQSDRQLGIPGEDLRNSLSATEFVAWYNGHPDYADLDVDLQCKAAVVVGVGNVAADVARILAKSDQELSSTDISDEALAKLRESEIDDIYVLARRGPAQAKFTHPELRELGELNIADLLIDTKELMLDSESERFSSENPSIQRLMSTMWDLAERQPEGKQRRIHLRFLVSPVEILGDDNGAVSAVRVEKNELRSDESGYLNSYGTGEFDTIPAGLVLRSVGYRGIPLADVPFDDRRGIIPNEAGRVANTDTREPIPGEYVVGWAKRGPSGVIGTNKPDALATVESMLADVEHSKAAPKPEPSSVPNLLRERNVRYVTIEDWRMLDQLEISSGAIHGRPRVKLTRINEILAALEGVRT